MLTYVHTLDPVPHSLIQAEDRGLQVRLNPGVNSSLVENLWLSKRGGRRRLSDRLCEGRD